MPRTTVKMPKLGETVDEVVILEWVKAEGEPVALNEVILRVETDKVDAELPSPVPGTMVSHLVHEGDEVATGAPVCVIEA